MDKTITIVTIDSAKYATTAWAIDHTKKFWPNALTLTLGDKPYYDSDKHITVPSFDHKTHSELSVSPLLADAIDTDFALFVQWDGFPINAAQWHDQFFNYDYIGAPWPWLDKRYQVGNGGLSLRSKQLLDLVAEHSHDYDYNQHGPEDQWICRHLRPTLEQQGIKFAPVELAAKFSMEHQSQYHTETPWGIHGVWNMMPFLYDDGKRALYWSWKRTQRD